MSLDAPGHPSLRLGVRLAVREMRRRPWRAALVVLMVLLPTAAMTAGVIVARTSERSPQEAKAAQYGAADATARPSSWLEASGPDGAPPITEDDVAGLRARLPEGADVVLERQEYERLVLGDRRAYAYLSDLSPSSPIADGRFGALHGRLADAPGEVVLAESVADDLDAAIGDTVRGSRSAAELAVTGIITSRRYDNGAYLSDSTVLHAGAGYGNQTVWIDLPGEPHGPELFALTGEADGWTIEPAIATGDERNEEVFWIYVGGGVGLTVLSTIIAAAFAVGARRQLRTLGLLSATGASPRTLAWFLVVQGAVCGLAGSVVGAGLGVAGTRLLPIRVLRSLTDERVDGPVLRLMDLVPIVVLGTLVAATAAWFPARTASRVPTLQALAGRRPLPVVPPRLPLVGAMSIGGGCGLFAMAVAGASDAGSSLWAVVAIAGGLALLAGVVAIAPWVIAGLERVSARWPQAWRLAGRSLARSRVRSSAVVGAIATVAAALVAGGTLYASLSTDESDDRPYLRRDQLLLESSTIHVTPPSPEFPDGDYTSEPAAVPGTVLERIRAVAPEAAFIPLDVLVAEGRAGTSVAVAGFLEDEPSPSRFQVVATWPVAVASPALLDLFEVPADLRAALERGEAISVIAPPHPSSAVTITSCCVEGADRPPFELPLGGSFDSPAAASALPTILVPAVVARRSRFEPVTSGTVVWVPEGIDDRTRDRLELLAGDLRWETGAVGPAVDGQLSVDLQIETGDEPIPPALVKAGVAAAALVLVLAVVAVGLAMAAKDSEDERQVLAAVGAPPRTLRQVGVRRAVLLTMCGAVLAVPTGLLPAMAIVAAATDPADERYLQVDLWAVVVVVVAIPLVAGGAAALAGRVRDALRPARPDSLTFAD